MRSLKAELKEDVGEDTKFTTHVKDSLSRYSVQHDYPGKEWHGVEKFCYDLAKLTPVLGVESPGWYKYKSSTREDMDGKDWRYVIPDPLVKGSSTVVNCHSLLHDGVWTLATTIYSSREVDLTKVPMLSHSDHWTRTFFWEMATANVLERDGYCYTEAIQDMQKRYLDSQTLKQVVEEMLPDFKAAYQDLYGKNPSLRHLSLGVSEALILKGKIGRHEGPKNDVPYSVLSIHPVALNDASYLKQVLKHELIHFLLGEVKTEESHGDMFGELATELGLPEKYQD